MEQENKNTDTIEKKDLVVRQEGDKWEVLNHGDSAVLFSSTEKVDAIKFAQHMAETHKVKVNVEGDETDADTHKKLDIIVKKDGEEWIVQNEGDTAVLFSSSDKSAALDFADQVAKEHNVKVKEE